jgi:c-di-GMP-binding flagellar brake protein YcgR
VIKFGIMINKRRHKRVPISGTASLKFEDEGEIQSIQSMTGSISLGGIGLYSDDRIEINSSVLITIDFIAVDGTIKTDSIEGIVIYEKKIGDIYFLGVQFHVEINPDDQPSLFGHIQKVLAWDAQQ